MARKHYRIGVMFSTTGSYSVVARSMLNGALLAFQENAEAGGAVALANKLTLVNKAGGVRILPAYYSDNYVSLLPGESREVDIEYPVSAASGEPQVNLRGWTLAPTTVPISRGTEPR